MNFARHYRLLIHAALTGGIEEMNRRTGVAVRALAEGASFAVDLSDGILPTCGLRRTRPHIAAAELAWCLLGHNHIDWLRKHTKVWDSFADAQDCVHCDGTGSVKVPSTFACTNCNGSGKTYWLDQAYGYRWRFKFGYDQLLIGVDRLRVDPSDRRVWISSWDQNDDLVPNGQKTVPCPVGFTLSLLAGSLNSTLMIRSSDLYMGLPYDVMRHALLMNAIAATLKVHTGQMRITLAHPHIYATHFANCREMLNEPVVIPQINMPEWPIDDVTDNPDTYVSTMKTMAMVRGPWPVYDPKAEVVR